MHGQGRERAGASTEQGADTRMSRAGGAPLPLPPAAGAAAAAAMLEAATAKEGSCIWRPPQTAVASSHSKGR